VSRRRWRSRRDARAARREVDLETGGRTIVEGVRGPLAAFVRSETRGAALLGLAIVLALVWANIGVARYETWWTTPAALQLGPWQLSMSLREWVNGGFMALFFFVVGLEARREVDEGELRRARAVILPLLAGLAGLAVPIGIYLVVAGRSGAAHAWGAAMSTDTAFTLGVLAVVGPRYADRLRAFVVSVLVVDDLVALLVIAVFYSHRPSTVPLVVTAGLLVGVFAVRAAGVRNGWVYAALGVAAWATTLESGIDPLLVGFTMGLLAQAEPVERTVLEHASDEFRRFREQPTGTQARRARAGLRAAVSPNARLAALWYPWTANIFVPIFALANAGVPLTASTLSGAVT
jgi:Na+/H+ antiporter NhaA